MSDVIQTEQKPPWGIALIVVMFALLEVLDMTIVLVALQDMKGALSASPTQITWTITAYVVSSAVVMPMTGLLAARYGRKQLLIYSAIGFTASSFLCGLAQTLWQMVLFRGAQGLFGALLPPLAQATLVDSFSRKDLPKAMALYGIGLMVGPILGPVLGGLITDHLGWRFIFYVNVPVGIIGVLLASAYLPLTPKSERKLDVLGVVLLAFAVGSLQFVLDKGNEDNWFSSNLIVLMSFISLTAFILFLYKGWRDKDNVINFQVFKDKNFTLGCLAMFLYCAAFLGSLSWLPLILELFLNYPAETAGFALMSRGVACLVIIALTPKLASKVDSRYLVAISAVLYAAGMLVLARFNLGQGIDALLLPNILQGAATGFFFVPLNNLAYQSLSKTFTSEATGLLNFFRSMGSSVGVAVFSTLMSRQVQYNWHLLGEHVSRLQHRFIAWQNTTGLHIDHNPSTIAILGRIVNNQAYAMAFVHACQVFSLLVLFVVPAVLFMSPKLGRGPMGE